MKLSKGRRRLIAVGASAVLALTLGLGAPMAMADPTPSDDMSTHESNAEVLDPQCAVPPNHNDKVIKTVYSVAKKRNVTSKVMLATFEAGWVESHMNNLNCGDRDSVGVFQQRPSMGWCDPASLCRDVKHATNKFLDQAIPNDKKNPGYSAGQLAQSVQRSGYPDRYDQAKAKAQALIKKAKGGKVNPYSPAQVCGGNYKVIDHKALKDGGKRVGTVYLLYTAGKNCVVTLKDTKLGKASKATATLKVKGGKSGSDSGKFEYYAGPVKKSANKTCVQWGGSVGGGKYTSGWSHCG
ncbi:MAG TPA: hypothetical protein H9902_02380 [Candidatus Stackebrandtia faecavium]|nr:hypothetical protein [Candidatus Stackebrandtia faecavium]